MNDVFFSSEDFKEYYKWTHFGLCIVYLAMSSLSLFALVRRIIRVVLLLPTNNTEQPQPQPNISTREGVVAMKGIWGRWFHVFFLLGCFCRIAYFLYTALQPPNEAVSTPKLLFSWIPTFLFFSCFWVVLACWVEIYHQGKKTQQLLHRILSGTFSNNNNNSNTLTNRILMIPSTSESPQSQQQQSSFNIGTLMKIINATMMTIFALCVIIYIVSVTVFHSSVDFEIRFILHCITIVIYIILAFGYMIYGCLIMNGMRIQLNRPSLTTQQQSSTIERAHKVLFKVGAMSIVTFICFSLRASIIIWQLSQKEDVSDIFWWMDVGYYSVVEVLPLCLMIFVLSQSNNNNHESNSRRNISSSDPSTPLLGGKLGFEEQINSDSVDSASVYASS